MYKRFLGALFLIFISTACYAGKVGNLEVENTITLPSGSISEGSLPSTALIDSDIGSSVQAYDADLDDLADGSLTGSKVGSGINGENISDNTIDEDSIDFGTGTDQVSASDMPDEDLGDISISSGVWSVDVAGASSYDTIEDPADNSTIAFAGFVNSWTTNETASDFFNITNSGNFGDVSLFVLQATGNPTNGTMFEIINTDTNADSIIAPNFSLTQAGALTATTVTVDDESYGAGWNSDLSVPTKNAVYDKIETLSGGSSDVYKTLLVLDSGTPASTGDGKMYFPVQADLNGKVLSAVHAQVITAGTTNTLDVQLVRCNAVTSGNACSGTVADMLSTKLTIDSGEDSSDTAASAAVINTSNDDMTTNQVIRVDIDAVHSTPSEGLIITLKFI